MSDDSAGLDPNWTILFVCWLLVTGATLGSLFFSEIMDLPPCSLCWYQRMFMFPLPVILFMGLFPYDPKVVRYALPVAAIGWAISVYHLLLHSGVIPESAAPCAQGVSCTTDYLNLFGFVSIPLLSFLAFTTVIAGLVVFHRRQSR